MTAWSILDHVGRLASETPDGPALIDGDEVLTWDALARRVVRATGSLLGTDDAEPGERLAVVADDPISSIIATLAVLRAGAVAALIPAGLTARERLAAIEAFGRPRFVGRSLAIAASDGPFVPGLVGPRAVDPALRAVIVLTSGTSGQPKGVVLPEACLAASADLWLAVLPPATGWLLALGLSHVAGLGVVWRAIRAGVPIRVAPAGDPAAQLSALGSERPMSHVSLVPAQLARLLDAAGGERPAGLRAVLIGGGPVPPALVVRALDEGWPVYPTYGLSEAGSGVTVLKADAARLAPASVGQPLPGVGIWIDEPGPDGVGEILVTTPAGYSGYVGEAPRQPSDAIRTGDLGHIDAEGRLYVVDRRTDRIVRGGENISPAEVEAVLELHPGVAEAAVVGRPDPTWGQVPFAAIVARAGANVPSDADLAEHARASLAGFKVPAAWLRLDALPRTDSGKLRRQAVRALVDGSPAGILARPGGDWIGWRRTRGVDSPPDEVPLLILPGTLSTAAQVDPIATALAAGGIDVHAIDRRGSGTSRFHRVEPLDIGVHIADLVAYLDARGLAAAALVGISFGGVLALELAARHPDRVLTVVAWEPPYAPLADDAGRAWFAEVATLTALDHRHEGPDAAAETFLRAVAGDAAWDRLSERGRVLVWAEGDGALADSALLGLRPDGLGRIAAPTLILTGDRSRAMYGPLADAIARRVTGSRRLTLPGMTHTSPITDSRSFAAAVRTWLIEARVLPAAAVPR
jgi:O-succinylbenzoic acid--CoA ligase